MFSPESTPTPMFGPDEPIYDSFVIRLWHLRQGATIHRAEVRHVQTGETSASTEVDLDWICRAVCRLLGESQSRVRQSGE
jgi:hypothetical protein